MTSPFRPPLFELGPVYATQAAKSLIDLNAIDVGPLLRRHQAGDWLEMPEADRVANVQAVADGSRVFTRFTLHGGQPLWIITEAEDEDEKRPHTTVLLPSDY